MILNRYEVKSGRMFFTRILLTAGLVVTGLTAVVAQQDSTQYIYGLPVSEDDTVQQFPNQDLYPKNNVIRLSKNKIPLKLKKTLRSNEQYRGWENSTMYFDRNTGLYIIHLSNGDETWTYSFNRNGTPVSVNVREKRPGDQEG